MRPLFHRQRGAVVVYVAFFLMALIASTCLAIDIGRLYQAQRTLQSAANLAALDAAALTSGCYGNRGGDLQDDPGSVATAEAQASLARNGVPLAYLESVQIGKLSSANGIRSFTSLQPGEAQTSRTAVQVSLTRPTIQRLIPMPGSGGGVMRASAAANLRPEVSFSVGSGLASLDGGILNALLGALLHTNLSLSVADYNALLGVNVRLGDLSVALGAASVDDFLTSQTTLPRVIDALVYALGNGQNGVVRQVLNLLAGVSTGVGTIVPGDVLLAPVGLEGDGSNALVNVGQLIMALAMSANGQHALDLPISTALGSIRLTVIEPPQMAIARAGDLDTYATTSQVKLDIDLALRHVDVNVLGLVGAQVDLQVPLQLRVGKATAHLDEVECRRAGTPTDQVTLGIRTSVLDLGIGTFTTEIGAPSPSVQPVVLGNISAKLLGIRIPIATVSAGVYAGLGADADDDVPFEGPFPSEVGHTDTDVSRAVDGLVSDLISSLEQPDGLKVTLLGVVNVPAGSLVAVVLNLLKPVLHAVGLLLEPLLGLLGLSLGTADAQVWSMTPVNPNSHGPDDASNLSLRAFLFNH